MKLIDRVHQRWMNWALKKCKNNRTHAAKLLGISVRTLRTWINKYKTVSAPLPKSPYSDPRQNQFEWDHVD